MKQKKPFQSRNFWIAIISILLAIFTGGSGIAIGLTPEALLAALATKQGIALISFLLINLINPIIKLIGKVRKGEWSWEFLWGSNFKAQIGSVIAVVLAMWLDEGTIGIVLAGIMHGYNYLMHILFKDKVPPPSVA